MIVFPRGHVPQQFPVFHLGFGPDAFIANAGWHGNYSATNLYRLAWLCPSRNAEKAAQMGENLRLPAHCVSHDYAALLASVFGGGQNRNAVVCITTETGFHAQHITQALAAGAKYLLVDKPLVRDCNELGQVRQAVKTAGAVLGLTYNHIFNAPVHQIRHLALTVGVKKVRSWFRQAWLDNNLKGLRQFDWRTDDPLCGPLDIWSHAENLASFATAQPLLSVSHVRLGTGGGHGKGEIYTSGTCNAHLAGGVEGEIEFHQALPGNRDNIGVCVTLNDGRHVMWQLELGVDNLWTTKWHQPDCHGNLQNWERSMRGDGTFDPAVNQTFGETPPGHHHGWSSLWRYLFTAYAGYLYKVQGLNLGFADGQRPKIFDIGVPGLREAEQTARFVAAALQSANSSGKEVALGSIG